MCSESKAKQFGMLKKQLDIANVFWIGFKDGTIWDVQSRYMQIYFASILKKEYFGMSKQQIHVCSESYME